jgi:hypothetical protein
LILFSSIYWSATGYLEIPATDDRLIAKDTKILRFITHVSLLPLQSYPGVCDGKARFGFSHAMGVKLNLVSIVDMVTVLGLSGLNNAQSMIIVFLIFVGSY